MPSHVMASTFIGCVSASTGNRAAGRPHERGRGVEQGVLICFWGHGMLASTGKQGVFARGREVPNIQHSGTRGGENEVRVAIRPNGGRAGSVSHCWTPTLPHMQHPPSLKTPAIVHHTGCGHIQPSKPLSPCACPPLVALLAAPCPQTQHPPLTRCSTAGSELNSCGSTAPPAAMAAASSTPSPRHRLDTRAATCRAPRRLPEPMSRAISDWAATASASASSELASHSYTRT